MRLFSCDACANTVYFDNTVCVACNHQLGYIPHTASMTALEPDGVGWHSPALGQGFALCANAGINACNWLVPIEQAGGLCESCRHNRTIPDLSVPGNAEAFHRIVVAERHLFYSLLRWQLPTPTKDEDAENGLVFDFLADTTEADGSVNKVLTGHDNGVITLSIAEADDAEREARRAGMNEPYRTLLGHFRHEVGHYYWDRLVRDGDALDDFRALFGDERADYGEALAAHYANGPRPGWQADFVSAYASCHPWEDFAETWAHHMHIVDALETTRAVGLTLNPPDIAAEDLNVSLDFSPYEVESFQPLAAAWPPVTVAVNEINRSMGQPSLYPFVLSETILAKLAFVHRLIAHRPALAAAA